MELLHTNDTYENEFLPFMQGLMSSLLSKDMMYPALKEMNQKVHNMTWTALRQLFTEPMSSVSYLLPSR